MRRHFIPQAALEAQMIVLPDGSDHHSVISDAIVALEAEVFDLDRATVVHERLQRLQHSASTGALTAQTARVLAVATEHLLEEVGFGQPQILPALEAFETDAPAASQLAMESIGKAAKRVWQAIIAALKRAVAWIGKMIVRFLDSGKQLQLRAKRLSEQVLKAQHNNSLHPSVDRFIPPQSATRLNIGMGMPRQLVQEAAKTAQIVQAQLARLSHHELLQSHNGVIDKLLNGQAWTTGYMGAEERETRKLTHKGHESSSSFGSGTEYYSDSLLGNKFVSMLIGPDNSSTADREGSRDGTEAIRAWHWRMQTAHLASGVSNTVPTHSSESAHTVPVLSFTEMGQVLDRAELMTRLVLDFREYQERLKKLSEQMVEAAKKLALVDNSASQSAAMSHSIGMQRQYLAAAPRMFVHEPAQFLHYLLNTSTALMDYVESSLHQYETHEQRAQAHAAPQ